MRKKILYYIIFIIVILLVVDVYALIRTCREIEGRCKIKREEFISASYDVPKLENPFVHVYNNDGELTNIVLISAPMNRAQREIYKRYKDGLLFLGISSYLEFPEVISNPFDIYNDPKHETWDFNYSETHIVLDHSYYKKALKNFNKFPIIALGLGEKENEVFQTLIDLKENKVDVVTLGQYLQPSKKHLPVKNFINPSQFKIYENFANDLGFRHVESSALVRSSYKAQKHIN